MIKKLLVIGLVFISILLAAIQQPEELLGDIEDAERVMTRIQQLNALSSINEQVVTTPQNRDTDETINLWIYNFLNNSHTQITATRQINSTLCNIYVHDDIWNITIDQTDVEHLRNAFEDSTATDPTKGVYELDTEMFGLTSDIDGNGKTNILIYNIDDTNINGYFSPSDLLGGAYSNNMELIYIDDNPHDAGIHSSYCYATLAHEFQHLIHCNHDSNETTWVNEGLAGFAQWVNGWISPYWMMLFTQNPDNNLVHWAAGADYPQSYLFMHYLYEHYVIDEENIIFNLVQEAGNSTAGLDAALLETGWGTDISSIDVFNNWVIANHINDPVFMDGLYSYSDNPIGTGQFSLANTAEYSSYPVSSDNYSMNHWGVNYILFENTDLDLSVDFSGESLNSDFHVQFVKFYYNEPVEVVEMELDEVMSGSITLHNSGIEYDKVLMIVTDTYTSYTQIGYSYEATNSVSVDDEEINLHSQYSVTNYPNPFNPSTTITYNQSTEINEDVQIMIYNLKGQKVKQYSADNLSGKQYSVVWDGTDRTNKSVSSGIYYYKITCGNTFLTKRMLLIK
ncbi:MAG: T9SS type A sorting domain-containing protein [Candidatus Cloacimonetes bacterium]|jgi:hypothetical protein|nr:T9SS type A sorting domain-containing protein [Candidatus Cloacimonadota bacterium]